MKTNSQEFKDLMAKWSREAWAEEMGNAYDDYLANEDMHGRLDRLTPHRGSPEGGEKWKRDGIPITSQKTETDIPSQDTKTKSRP